MRIPKAIITTVMILTGLEARLSIKGSFLVLIICTIKVWVSKPTTNQPDWNRGAISGVLALKINHMTQKVTISKIEEIGPM